MGTLGIIGDFNPESETHRATREAIHHAAHALGTNAVVSWLLTSELRAGTVQQLLDPFDASWAAPGSPYVSMEGALCGIQFARERDRPFFRTRGGFQHALVEYARHVLKLQDADLEETAPYASTLIINRLAASLVGQTQTIRFTRGTKVHHAYSVDEASEEFRCNFGLNPVYRALVLRGPLQCSSVYGEGETRVVELTSHRFFIATLFLPQLRSAPAAPHPLIRAYLNAAVAFHGTRHGGKNRRKATT
ncbi:MAG: hypothetical protein JSW39_23900 [Desulfobacterales bacterium]|nr:MAG: hypothetical protein JSW39_23900 [Desulfobacterales bacterium]